MNFLYWLFITGTLVTRDWWLSDHPRDNIQGKGGGGEGMSFI